MSIHTCTRCPLRFATRAEMADHMAHDHRMPTEMLQAVTYPGAQEAAPLYRQFSQRDGVHRVLVVANQTLGADGMMRALRERADQHEQMSVLVLVPATPTEHYGSPPAGPPPRGDGGLDARTDDVGLATARYRLRKAIGMLSDEGVVAHGMIGDPNPVRAIATVMAQEPIDEMIVCTLKMSMSRWLHADLPTSLRRQYDCPITVLSVDPASAMIESIDLTHGVPSIMPMT